MLSKTFWFNAEEKTATRTEFSFLPPHVAVAFVLMWGSFLESMGGAVCRTRFLMALGRC